LGCETTDEVQVDIDDMNILPPTIQQPLCHGDCNGSVEVGASGYEPFSYNWNDGATGNTRENLCAGSYTLSVTDDIGCQDELNFTISQPDPLDAQFVTLVQPQCDGVGLGQAELAVSGGTPSYTIHWSDGATGPVNDEMYTGINTATITDAHGCDTTVEVEMVPPNNLATTLNNVEHNPCYGDCEGEISISVSGGTPPFDYYWNDGLTGQNISGLCAGLYQVTVIDADDCVIHRNVSIAEPDELIGYIQPESPILCYGETATLIAGASGGTQPYDFVWDNGSTASEIDSLPAGTYQTSITDAHNCVDTVEYILTQPPELLYQYSVYDMLCTGVCNGRIHINPSGGTPPYHFTWNETPGDSVATGLCAGDYTMVLSDDNGCTKSAEYEVESDGYIPPLEVDAEPDEIFVGMTTNLTATDQPGYQYHWLPDENFSGENQAEVVAQPDETTTFEVRIRDSLGCINKDTVVVVVKELICGEPYLYIPNAFTPNGDGENDYFKPYAPVGVVVKMYFAVYDRWGELIYETDNINDKGWDGTFRGKALPPDVYVYFFEATCLDQDTFSKKGNVTLIR
jgi:gliding motility-associated-like protein